MRATILAVLMLAAVARAGDERAACVKDVNVALDGHVEQSFTPYDHDVNLAVFRTLCDRYDLNVSEEVAVELMRLIESFACAP